MSSQNTKDVPGTPQATLSSDLKPAIGRVPLLKNPYQSAVTVKVGSEGAQRSFIVHTELLNYRSSFFKAATTGNWDEAKTGIINLPADDPQVFEIFLDWLYQRKLDLNAYQAQKSLAHLGSLDLWRQKASPCIPERSGRTPQDFCQQPSDHFARSYRLRL
ncbi:MAG: hypothetical protein Q9188_000812 [Gyalolechia gomerana]